MNVKNVFVLGMNDFNRAKLESLRGAEQCKFHGLLKPEDILDATEFPVREMLDTCVTTLREFPGSVDAVVGYMDFPVSTLLPLIARGVGLRTVSFEALLKCEHKYWSRLEQSRCIPEHVPRFALFDPFDEHALEQIGLPFPFWIKPVKSAGSWLGFRIGDEHQFRRAVGTIQKELGRFADPFNHLLEYADLPGEIAAAGGYACLAEQIISGWQFTVEGYARNGAVHTYGIVDSIRAPNRRSFVRYQYPSRLPVQVRTQAADVIARLLRHIGFDNAAFNVEFYWDRRSGRLWLLEVNTRIAQHHADLFEKVDGVSNQQVMLDVALGNPVDMPGRQGRFNCAAACFLRHYADAVVRHAPDEATIARLQDEIPGTVIEPHVEVGMQLSQMVDQDSYSYIVALIYLGASNPKELMRRYRYCIEQLGYDLVDVEAA
ncbi:MAG: ATP-grasp domain-containing protein [Halioglobus sp.]|nr:ATP-grasp domain-containing protein [Halioglobus sp.]